MFRTIQVLLIAAIAIAMILLFRRKLHREKSLVAGLLLCLLLAAVVSNGIVELIPLPTDPVIVTATGEKNEAASGNEAYLINYIVGGTEYEIQNATEGKWFWKGDVYMWRNENDPRQPDGTTRSITMQIPYGRDRSIQFGLSKWNGIVEVTYNGETQVYDLFKSGDKNSLYVPVPDTEAFALYGTKLLRLAAFLLIAAAIMACPVFCAVKYDDTAIKDFWVKHWDKLVYISIAVGCFFVMFESGKSGSLWFDEVWSVGWIYDGFPEKIGRVWYGLYKVWFYLVPYGQEYLLAISELLVAFSIYVSGLIGSLYQSKRLGIIMAALLASSTTVLYQCGGEFRNYAILLFSVSLVVYFFIRKQKELIEPKMLTLILYGASLGLCMDSHRFGFMTAGLMMAFDFMLIILKRLKIKSFLEFLIPLGYGFYYVISQFAEDLSIAKKYSWPPMPTIKGIKNCIVWLCGDNMVTFLLMILGSIIIIVTIANKIVKRIFDFKGDYILLVTISVPSLLFLFDILYSTVINPNNSLFVNRYLTPCIVYFEFFIALAVNNLIDCFDKNMGEEKGRLISIIATVFVGVSFCVMSWSSLPSDTRNSYKEDSDYLMQQNDIYNGSTLCITTGVKFVDSGFQYYLTQNGKRDPINHCIYSRDLDFSEYETIYVVYLHSNIDTNVFVEQGYSEVYTNDKMAIKKFVKI